MDVEVVKKLKVLKYKADLRDAEITPLEIVKTANFDIIHFNGTCDGCENAGDQVQKCGFTRTARPDHSYLLRLLHSELGNAQAEITIGITKFQRSN